MPLVGALAAAALVSDGGRMMSEAKSFASLSPTLLARKGHAKPAMRPQSFRFANEEPNAALANAHLDDLGWNDMGHDLPVTPISLHSVASLPYASAEPPAVFEQQQMLAVQFHEPEAAMSEPPLPEPVFVETKATVRMAAGSKAKAAFTLRLDPERHLRLRIVCAVNHRSAQQIVTLALDEFLSRQPENSALIKCG